MSDAKAKIVEEVIALRERWHTKRHPLFQDMAQGKAPLRALGLYMAGHYRFVSYALPSMGLLYSRAPLDVRKAVASNLSEEEGLLAIPRPGHKPHDHNEMIFAFCTAAGFSRDQVEHLQLTPAWWARALHYSHVLRVESMGVTLAMQSTQEGQQVALNREITLPAFQKYYGYTLDSPEIAFFVEHAEADEEHSRRQLDLCAKYVDPAERDHLLEVCETAVRLRWASLSEVYRSEVLKEPDILPPGLSAAA